jgi:outer membrane receptor protein involved in Fe transport
MPGKLLQHCPLFAFVVLFLCSRMFAEEMATEKDEGLFDLSIEQLMEVEVDSTATLTEAKPRLVPAAVTTITAEQIRDSGARSLFELLDIYVPNLQWWRNHWEPDNLGLRGILSDRDDKYLLLVNGRVMNERTHYGALSERDLVLLSDIHHIDIVRGSGSALYGPGAVSMVINIITYNALTFEGTEVAARLGAFEEFYSTEIKHGQKFDDGDGGIFAYAGIAEYHGADEDDAPQIYGFDFPPTPVGDTPMPQDGHPKGEPFTEWSVNDQEAHRGLPPLKFYTELTRSNWNAWARYTRGGQQYIWPTGFLARAPYGWTGSWALPHEYCTYGYQQLTGFIGNNIEFNENTNLDLAFSYDMFDFENRVHTWIVSAHREDKYIGKAILRHDINNQHKIAVGTEVLHGEYGFNSPGWPHVQNTFGMGRWSTNMYSAFGEHQWTINEQWTTFIGGRIDDHSYTKRMFSPRASVIYTPNKKDTYKLIWARSVRANYEEEMKGTGLHDNRPEKLDSIELRYERQQSEHLDIAASIFNHYNLELIGWSNAESRQTVVGTLKEWGLELEANYHTDRTYVIISHGYTKMIDFELANPNMVTTDPLIQFSANPYG